MHPTGSQVTKIWAFSLTSEVLSLSLENASVEICLLPPEGAAKFK